MEVIGATMDWLGSIRTYVDHNNYRASRSGDTEILDFFKSMCSRQYDDRFGYRFCIRLRNYAQHLGIPLHGLNLNGEFLILYRENLLTRFNGWSAVAAELKAGPPEIPLIPAVKDAMEGLRIITNAMSQRLSSDVDAALKDAQGFREFFNARHAGSVAVHYEMPEHGPTAGGSLDLKPIALWAIDSVEVSRNAVCQDFSAPNASG